MASNWSNIYAQTSSYFVLKSILTIVSSFVSIGILIIHWIEHSNHKYLPHKFEFDTSTSRSIAPTPSIPNTKIRKYTSSQAIIIRLSWATITIFCSICIVFSSLNILEQVAGLNEVQIILCNIWTTRVLISTFQFGVGLMHCLFMAQLYEIYNNTDFTYSLSK
eukprot:404172_1